MTVETDAQPQRPLSVRQDIGIVIAEDDPGHYVLARNCLRSAGITNEILWFEDGQAVLDFFSKLDRKGGRYILLLDIRMPKVDGMKVLETIKKDPVLRDIPVIMLTTSEDQELAKHCYDLGCEAHIIKPPGKVLLKAIERLSQTI
ncbi:MAG TPA: response regulator [Anaerohalosphaeraceae bacterium]|nr:response regulator [Phycisphaerae bacterium]HOK95943.1 response regulator [Anaerohalosphaeraceae bacterium]HOL31576.1 response regulator [Anaerohalosphaeraceae bacterium]HPC63756.1 response regulator [Anaerohalosphaeraceae bacterium]HPO69058.1 response regulator [Anaerohalosphaeraceae bacterium]